MKTVLWLTLVVSILGCSTTPVYRDASFQFSERILLSGRHDISNEVLKVGPDMLKAALLIEDSSSSMVSVNGKLGPKFEKIQFERSLFSPNGKRFAYPGWDEGACVVVDGEIFARGDGDYGFYFYRHGEGFFALLKSGDQMAMYTSPEQVVKAEHIGVSTSRFDIGLDYAFVNDGTSTVVTPEFRDRIPYETASAPMVSPDGEHYLLRALKDETFYVMLDGLPIDSSKWVPYYPMWRSDGREFGYLKRLSETECVAVVGGVEEGPHEFLDEITYAPEGDLYKYFARDDGKWKVIVKGFESEPIDEIVDFRFSDDGKRWYSLCKRGEKTVLLLDGENKGEFDLIKDVRFSPGSSRFTYIVDHGTHSTLYIDDKEVSYTDAGWTTFSQDGSHYAYVIAEGGGVYSVMLDGDKVASGPPAYQLTLSPDGSSLVYMVSDETGEYVASEGAAISPPYERIFGNVNGEVIKFVDNDTIRFVALKKNGDIVSVEIDLR